MLVIGRNITESLFVPNPSSHPSIKSFLSFSLDKLSTINCSSHLLSFELHLMSLCSLLLIHHCVHYHLIDAESEKQKRKLTRNSHMKFFKMKYAVAI